MRLDSVFGGLCPGSRGSCEERRGPACRQGTSHSDGKNNDTYYNSNSLKWGSTCKSVVLNTRMLFTHKMSHASTRNTGHAASVSVVGAGVGQLCGVCSCS